MDKLTKDEIYSPIYNLSFHCCELLFSNQALSFQGSQFFKFFYKEMLFLHILNKKTSWKFFCEFNIVIKLFFQSTLHFHKFLVLLP